MEPGAAGLSQIGPPRVMLGAGKIVFSAGNSDFRLVRASACMRYACKAALKRRALSNPESRSARMSTSRFNGGSGSPSSFVSDGFIASKDGATFRKVDSQTFSGLSMVGMLGPQTLRVLFGRGGTSQIANVREFDGL